MMETMKKWMKIVAFFAAVVALSAGCSNKKESDGKPGSAPVITLEGGDISQPQEIVQDMTARILISAPERIRDFTVKIDSPALTDELLGALHLSTTLDMAHPSEEAAAALPPPRQPGHEKAHRHGGGRREKGRHPCDDLRPCRRQRRQRHPVSPPRPAQLLHEPAEPVGRQKGPAGCGCEINRAIDSLKLM